MHMQRGFTATHGSGYGSSGWAAARMQGWGTNMMPHGLSLSLGSWANKADKEIKGGDHRLAFMRQRAGLYNKGTR